MYYNKYSRQRSLWRICEAKTLSRVLVFFLVITSSAGVRVGCGWTTAQGAGYKGAPAHKAKPILTRKFPKSE